MDDMKLDNGWLRISIRMFRVRQLTERKKWIHQFENIASVIFIVDLCCYDEVALEDREVNRMTEALTILDSIANEKWFRDTSIILLLHNINQFEQKLDKVPLKNYFSDFNGGNDVN